MEPEHTHLGEPGYPLPAAPEEIKRVADSLKAAESSALKELPAALVSEEEQSPASATNLNTLIRDMTIPQKIKLALFGNGTARQILIRDSSKMVVLFVLQNSRITDGEIADYSKNTSLEDTALRTIAGNSSWIQSYTVKYNLVCNPKTPIDISLKWVKFLHDKDLRKLARSKSVPGVVSTQARKLLERKG